ncbi:peptidoglycan recognition protein family protein [Streptomyces sp. NBC_01760]|uniref:peptidoglycan recognition protein family protein n=1 Tax=Streptomyces sp. NBC_01760 TaxID=2975931 RepID=UPI002DDAD501|nr:N-acetylmuramoyl-L-alanine amidase [Streptomyces sp. NBC_01760]
MAAPLSAASFISALRAEGLTVVEVGNWRTHNRNSKGSWGPMNGVMVHHTVTKGTPSTVQLCKDGHSTLPGPLCHGVIGKDGRVYLVGYGRANHAGGGDLDVLNAVIAESYATNPPATHKGEGDSGAADGNSRFYGFECENLGDGNDPWPTAQIEAITRATAAVCRAHGWGSKSVIGHLEWSRQKSDPKGFTMASVRTRVAERLKHAANWTPPTKPPAPQPTTIESRVSALEKLVASQAKRIETLEKKAA